MNVLLLGAGGREHALAWRLSQSKALDRLYAAPGNPGIAAYAEIAAIDPADHRGVIDFCLRNSIGFVVIGPEAPLVDGLADNIRTMGIGVFGPGREAARLEGSKGFTKDLCARLNIPTARYARVTSRDGARAALDEFDYPLVIKDDGLAAGKGVTIAAARAEAEAAIDALIAKGRIGGDAVIEEFLEGEEASLFVLSDGQAILPFGSAQDHKRAFDGDTGPNTGGMGAYSPAPVLTPELERRAIDTIVRPTIAALAAAGSPYRGVLYAGLMLTDAGPKLIEYNVRFGDPEAQVLMLRLEDDLLELMLATEDGTLADRQARFAEDSAVVVVMAANGYPGTPQTGGTVAGLDRAEATGARVFQAGTATKAGALIASGGRVLGVAAIGADLAAAQAGAYAGIDSLDFADGFCRRDIGWRELTRGDGSNTAPERLTAAGNQG